MPEEDPKNKKEMEEEPQGAEAQAELGGDAKEQAELKDRLLRLAAEFDNYKKRVAKDIDNSKEMGRADVITKLLPSLDEFELAIDSLDKKDEHVKGISLVYGNMMNTLKGFGLREIEA